MKYCNQCGAPLSLRIPSGDNLPRHVCDKCGAIHYQNPKNVVGCIPEWEGRILLCKRSINPRAGYWTLPAGFMENGETMAAAAAREALEEACATVDNLNLYGLFNLPHINQVYLMFRGRLRHGKADAGDESSEVRLFDEEEIPWDELAFPVIQETLELFFEDRRNGEFPVRMGDVIRRPDQSIEIIRY